MTQFGQQTGGWGGDARRRRGRFGGIGPTRRRAGVCQIHHRDGGDGGIGGGGWRGRWIHVVKQGVLRVVAMGRVVGREQQRKLRHPLALHVLGLCDQVVWVDAKTPMTTGVEARVVAVVTRTAVTARQLFR